METRQRIVFVVLAILLATAGVLALRPAPDLGVEIAPNTIPDSSEIG